MVFPSPMSSAKSPFMLLSSRAANHLRESNWCGSKVPNPIWVGWRKQLSLSFKERGSATALVSSSFSWSSYKLLACSFLSLRLDDFYCDSFEVAACNRFDLRVFEADDTGWRRCSSLRMRFSDWTSFVATVSAVSNRSSSPVGMFSNSEAITLSLKSCAC